MRPPTLDAEFSDLIPKATNEELAQLQNNLLTTGKVRDPLVVWDEENILLDGYTRLAIAEKYNLPYETVRIKLPSREAARDWIIKNQIGRRNLEASQRAMLAARLVDAKVGGNRTSDSANVQNGTTTVKQASLLAGVSERAIHHAKQVQEHGSEALQEAVRNGEVAVSDAAKVTSLPKPKQDEAVRKKRAGAAKTVAAESREQRLKRLAKEQNGAEAGQAKLKREMLRKFGELVRGLTDLGLYSKEVRGAMNVVKTALDKGTA